MFDRVRYKKNAKLNLKGRWKIPILITIISLVLGFFMLSTKVVSIFPIGYLQDLNDKSKGFSLIAFCITAILLIAHSHVYVVITNTARKIEFNDFLDGLSYCFKAILALLWYVLWIFIWTLLFVIPGIVKMFSYSQMFFLIAEYPNISVRKAMRISKVITTGYKSDLFVMWFSFLGWHMLSLMSFGIGFVWLVPYEMTSFANAYKSLKLMALNSGAITYQDFQK